MRKDPQALRFCLASNTKAEIKEGGNKEGVGLGGGVGVGVQYHLQSRLC